MFYLLISGSTKTAMPFCNSHCKQTKWISHTSASSVATLEQSCKDKLSFHKMNYAPGYISKTPAVLRLCSHCENVWSLSLQWACAGVT